MRSVLLAVSLLLTSPVFALGLDAYYFHPLHLENSHHTDSVLTTVRDQDGFLWLGTDNGLKRYDGFNLRKFVLDTSEYSQSRTKGIFDLLSHSNGQIWVASSGLFLYDSSTESFTQYNIVDYANIRSIEESHTGRLWLGGDNFGLKLFNPKTEEVEQTYFEGQPEGVIQNIKVDSNGHLWVTSDAGVYFFNTVSFEINRHPISFDKAPHSTTITGLDIDQSGKVWLSSNHGLYTISPETHEIKTYKAAQSTITQEHLSPIDAMGGITVGSLKVNQLSALLVDSTNRVWIATDKHGLHLYKPDTDNFYRIPPSSAEGSLPKVGGRDIYEDTTGSLWLSMGLKGVYRLSPNLEKFARYRHNSEFSNSLSFNRVLDLHEDEAGQIWIATDGGGLNVLNPSTGHFTHHFHAPADKNTLSSNSTVAIEQTPDGTLWVGTWEGGLNKLDRATNRVTRYMHTPTIPAHKTLANNNIFSITNTGDGRLILSAWDTGIQVFNPKTETFDNYFYDPVAEPQNNGYFTTPTVKSINAIIPHKPGVFWLAGYNGLEKFHLKDEKFEPVPLITDVVFDVHQDASNTLWIASSSGLIQYLPAVEQAFYFTQEHGLSDNFVLSIEEDNQGMLWIATRNGLNKFNKIDKTFETFKDSDGLSGNQFNRSSHLTAQNGLMYFGTSEGLTVFDPNTIPRNENSPAVHFLNLELYQKPVQPGSTPWLPKPLNSMETLTLPNSQRDIAFTYTALEFINVKKNKFRYRLYGLESEWAESGSDIRRVRYTNLTPGDYAFQIISANSDGVWNGTAREIKLKILPAWWQTWWAKALYGLTLILGIYLYGQWKQRNNRRNEAYLKQTVEEQTAQLKQANLSIIQANNELEQRVEQRTQALSLEVEERRESEAKVTYIAYHDPLTGLKNRTWVLGHLHQCLLNTEQDPFAVFFIGGDHFRKINDTHGHLTGDRLLIGAARRLQDLLHKDHSAIRLGSDEFAVVIEHYASEKSLERLAKTICDKFQEPFEVGPVNINFGVSVGIVCSDEDYSEPTQLLRDANIAMQNAKDQGRGNYQFFDAKMLEATKANMALEADLKIALANDEFSVVYQPIVSIEPIAINGFEVLMRWKHPKLGMIPPDKFIATAESAGLIYEMGLWVVRQACKQLQQWAQDPNVSTLPNVSINISSLQLNQKDLLERIDEILESTTTSARHLKFEITESALMENIESVEPVLEGLRHRGFDLAIDDFGTGYSSLSYLDRLPVQFLKIDRAFVNSLFQDEVTHGNTHKIVKATISLAHDLNMLVVAEGIETQEQLDILKSYDCDYGQGYFIAKPLPAKEATAFLIEDTNKP